MNRSRRLPVRLVLIMALLSEPTGLWAGALGAGTGSGIGSIMDQVSIDGRGIAVGTTQGYPSCLNWELTGICLWLICTMYGCKVNTSYKYAHFNPDAFVASYNGLATKSTVTGSTSGPGKTYGNPWHELREAFAKISTPGARAELSAFNGGGIPFNLFGGAERTEGGPGRPDHTYPNHNNLLFKDVDAVGHPMANALYKISKTYFCQSDATLLDPYLLSALDAIGWRWAYPDVLYPTSWVPGLREIGNWPLNTWGNVMPRTGFGIQSDAPKIGAVTAQRAADIITNANEGHVYLGLGSGKAETKLSDDKKQMVFTPEPIKENENTGGIWQMLVPTVSKTCEVFGSNDTTTVSGWGGGKVSKSGDYAFVLWRPYRCCEKKEGVFIGSIDFFGGYPRKGMGDGSSPGLGSSGTGSTSNTSGSGGSGQ